MKSLRAASVSGRKGVQSSRRAGLLYTGLALAVVMLVAVMALSVSQSPPPAIAELAPSAVEQIKDAPQDQSSELGSGEGGAGAGGSPTTTTTTTPTAVAGATTLAPKLQPRLRRCVGDPPRQTEDPQSPPCVPGWSGKDNGGATYPGVTAEEIRVVLPGPVGVVDQDYKAMEAHFNARYEFYGRKLKIIGFKHSGHNTTCSVMKADAIRVAVELEAFASIGYAIQRGAEGCYYDELASRGVMSMQMGPGGPTSGGEEQLERFAPYQWNYAASIDKVLKFMGELICKNLAGRPPVHAGEPQRSAPTRKFGIIRDIPTLGPALDTGLLESAAKACGVSIMFLDQDANQDRPSLASQAILKFKEAGVTTVACLCDDNYLGHNLHRVATTQEYSPEWIAQDYLAQDLDTSINTWPDAKQKARTFGIRAWNKPVTRDQAPYWQAFREGDPTIKPNFTLYHPHYLNLLILASGIQAAGPFLVPQTFQVGLYRAKFPNPGCGGPPVYQACVGFGPQNHTMVQDAGLIWYGPNEAPRDYDPAVFGPKRGTYCFIDGGSRHRPGSWPVGELPFFKGPCA